MPRLCEADTDQVPLAERSTHVSLQQRSRKTITLAVLGGALLIVVPFWYWIIERVEVPAEHYLRPAGGPGDC